LVAVGWSLSVDREAGVAADTEVAWGRLAEALDQRPALRPGSVGFEAELCSGVVSGAFGVAEVTVEMPAVGGGAERTRVVVGGDAVSVAVGLDGGDAAFPGRAVM
jgi:hypothetical protein